MKQYIKFKLVYIILFLFLSAFAFYLAFSSFSNYLIPYHKLNVEKSEISELIKINANKESPKIIIKLASENEIHLYEGFGEHFFKQLKSNFKNKKLSCKYSTIEKTNHIIFNPSELIIDGKKIINYQERQKSDLKFILFIFIFGIFCLTLTLFLIRSIFNYTSNKNSKNSVQQIIGRWYFS